MKITFSCTHCGAEIRTPGEWAGRSAACPSCRGRVTVPHTPAEPAKPAGQAGAPPSPAGKAAAKPAPSPVPGRSPPVVLPKPAKPSKADQGLYEIGSIDDVVKPASTARDPDEEENPFAVAPAAASDHIRFSCPSCRAVIRAPKSVGGKKSRCPECKERLVIPEAAGPEKDDDDLFEVEAAPDSQVHKREGPEYGLGPTMVTGEAETHIRFDCRSCGASIKAPRVLAGKKSRCPGCRTQVFVPQSESDYVGEDSLELQFNTDKPGASLQWKDPAADGPGLGPTGGGTPRAEGPSAFVRFNCGECGSAIKAPASVAGKKSTCPSCKAPVRIPRPAGPPEESIEIQLLDGPVRRPDKPSESSGWDEVRKAAGGNTVGPQTHIRFVCEYCDAAIKVALQYAGKKSRCPSCKERVRIPKGPAPQQSPEVPVEIDLLAMDSDDERRITENLSRQTGAKSLAGRPLTDTEIREGESLSDGAGDLVPLDSSDDIERAPRSAKPEPRPPGNGGAPPPKSAGR